MPPPEFAAEGVYCTGDECHKIAPKWERDKKEVMPPKSSIAAVWSVEGFGEGKGSGGKNAPIHFGDTTPASAELGDNESKLAPKSPAKTVQEKVPAANGKGRSPASQQPAANSKNKNGVKADAKNGAARKAAAVPAPPNRSGKKPAPVPQGKRR
jgi:hypothetical protein